MWLTIGVVLAVLIGIAAGLWIVRYRKGRNLYRLLWSPVGKHTMVILLVVLFLGLLNSHATDVAEQKAGDWLTSYNGSVTTDVVGPIKAEAGAMTVPNSTASPSATPASVNADLQTAAQTPEPSPTTETNTNAPAGTNVKTSGSPTPAPTPTAAEQKRLDAQLRTIRDRIKHHGDMMAYFYVNYFVAIVMVMAAGLIVAVTLFFIAQKGWSGTNPYVKTIFISASMIAAFFGLFPPVFQQEKNITDNKALFLEYKGLESEVESYPVTYLTLKNEPKTPKEFINHVDAQMDRLGNIALGFDVTKISYEQAISLSKPTPTNSTPNPANSNSKSGK